jgi:hypothetical protein
VSAHGQRLRGRAAAEAAGRERTAGRAQIADAGTVAWLVVVPLLLALAVVAAVRRAPLVPARAAAIGVPLAQALAVLAAAVCVVAQYRISYGPVYSFVPKSRSPGCTSHPPR